MRVAADGENIDALIVHHNRRVGRIGANRQRGETKAHYIKRVHEMLYSLDFRAIPFVSIFGLRFLRRQFHRVRNRLR